MFTLQSAHQHGVAGVAFHARQDPIHSDKSPPLEAKGGQAVCLPVNSGKNRRVADGHEKRIGGENRMVDDSGRTPPLQTGQPHSVAYQCHGSNVGPMGTLRGGNGNETGGVPFVGVRRLTPTECERLQGFPDGWTQVPYRGKPAKDGPRYRAIGNAMAVPVMAWIGKRIQTVGARS